MHVPSVSVDDAPGELGLSLCQTFIVYDDTAGSGGVTGSELSFPAWPPICSNLHTISVSVQNGRRFHMAPDRCKLKLFTSTTHRRQLQALASRTAPPRAVPSQLFDMMGCCVISQCLRITKALL